MTTIFSNLQNGLQRGDEVMVDGDWYPVLGYAMTVQPGGSHTGDVFTAKPRGKIGPLGYRIDVTEIKDARRPAPAEEAQS